MTSCAICDRPCIPMADYDVPTCIDCDESMSIITVRSMIGQPFTPAPILLTSDFWDDLRDQVGAA